MEYEELLEIFNCVEETETEGVYQTDKLLEIRVTFNDNKHIVIFFGERVEYLDFHRKVPEGYIGLGSVLVSPLKDIRDIEVKWR